jgi:hypothetical protein
LGDESAGNESTGVTGALVIRDGLIPSAAAGPLVPLAAA